MLRRASSAVGKEKESAGGPGGEGEGGGGERIESEEDMGAVLKVGANGKDRERDVMKWKGSGGGFGGSIWQCVWALLIVAAMCVYGFTMWFGGTCETSGSGEIDDNATLRIMDGRDVKVVKEEKNSITLPETAGGIGLLEWQPWSGDLRKLETPWNRLCYGPPPILLRIALFVKKWPVGGTPGGLERHAMTLHRVLADRGHEVHVFTMSGDLSTPKDVDEGNLHIHFVKPNSGGGFSYSDAWDLYVGLNTSKPCDIVHTESVALPHWRARDVQSLAASWHGIAFEVIHSDIVHDLIRKPNEARSSELQKSLSERLSRVADEVRFFPSYRHHVATSDYVGDVLRTIYELPVENVHVILNGVDETKFRPDPVKGAEFRARFAVPANASLVLGAAGRLVRDKGHPLLFEAFSEILKEHSDVYLLIAGKGPWGERYKELAPNAKTLGPMTPAQLAEFYNSLDIFVNPTLRSQGLDHTLLEAMQCGKPLLATKFSSITWSVIINQDFGYTFSPNVDALVRALKAIIKDGKQTLSEKGEHCLKYASYMFTATKMGSSYERLFLCMKNSKFCHYPLPTDCRPQRINYFN